MLLLTGHYMKKMALLSLYMGIFISGNIAYAGLQDNDDFLQKNYASLREHIVAKICFEEISPEIGDISFSSVASDRNSLLVGPSRAEPSMIALEVAIFDLRTLHDLLIKEQFGSTEEYKKLFVRCEPQNAMNANEEHVKECTSFFKFLNKVTFFCWEKINCLKVSARSNKSTKERAEKLSLAQKTIEGALNLYNVRLQKLIQQKNK